jgi:hypothetical protein
MPADDAPITQAHATVERMAALLDEVHTRKLEGNHTQPPRNQFSAWQTRSATSS